MTRLGFEVTATAGNTQARAGRFRTLHGDVVTPVFMPVGTQAAVRGTPVEDIAAAGTQVLLANAYHLLLRPGTDVLARLGGIHRFMNWGGSVLTDSGGYQVFSLPTDRVITEQGAVFRSYVDGARIELSPELSVAAQLAIGSDIMMAMDQCVPSTSDRATAADAMHRTHRWAERSLAARGDAPQALFGIVQGACFDDLRQESAATLTRLPFDGFAIGGLAVGESKVERERCTALTAALLPRDLPRYLMGVGTPIDLLEAVDRGVDMFDCIVPSALAKQGVAFTSAGRLHLFRSVYKQACDAVDVRCGCATCRGYPRAYLHHLVKTGESLGTQLLTRHNLHFYHDLMRAMRQHVVAGTFASWRDEQRALLVRGDDEHPPVPTRPKRRRSSSERFAVCVSNDGHASVVDRASGEVMHPGLDPMAEAHALYVEQSRLVERLAEPSEAPLVIWDVGLGAACNAVATITVCEATASRRAVHLVSFEHDDTALRLALRNVSRFPHLQSDAPRHLLRYGEWRSTQVELVWTLLRGDFRIRLTGAPAPDCVFYDPFSYKTDVAMWTLDCFERVFAAAEMHDTEMFTYSSSTAVRAALLAAGFVVARGVPTGGRAETTIAMTPEAALRAVERRRTILGADWLDRWRRSGAKFPSDVPADARDGFAERITRLAQFRPAAVLAST